MTREEIDLLVPKLQETHCPVCGHRAIKVWLFKTKSRKAYHSVAVKCDHCQARAQLWGMSGWKNSRATNVLIDDLCRVRDERVAKELMACD